MVPPSHPPNHPQQRTLTEYDYHSRATQRRLTAAFAADRRSIDTVIDAEEFALVNYVLDEIAAALAARRVRFTHDQHCYAEGIADPEVSNG